MPCYVDDVRHQFRNMVMCHLWADSRDELFHMVDLIGVPRKWFQCPPKASWEHFDISISKKKLALQHGAILTDKYGPVMHVATQRFFRHENIDYQIKLICNVVKIRAARLEKLNEEY